MSFLELHLIQNIAPANLNRDDTGSPKDAVFGGVRRARISSQALKRAMRRHLTERLPADQLATRTKRVGELVAKKLAHRPAAEVELAVSRLFETAGIGIEKAKGKAGEDTAFRSSYLLFLGDDEATKIAALAETHWELLISAKPDLGKIKREAVAALSSTAVDIALFGRMVADLPETNVDGACSVAHAISTHRLEAEFEDFTAMDDLSRPSESGAAMIESTGFNSACFYRYAAIDLGEIAGRIGDERLRASIGDILDAAIIPLPTGKQHSFAAHNLPAYVVAVVRDEAPISIANAFAAPVRPSAEHDLVAGSVAALIAHRAEIAAMYGSRGERLVAVAGLPSLPGVTGSLEEIKRAIAEIL
jgi:CRISPR system Cascade subunit CasC